VRVITSEASKVIHCRGALATERRLLREMDRLSTREPDDLGAPVRIIVPSRSLRLHLMRRLVAERGAVAGVVVQTLGGVVREISERTGCGPSIGVSGFEAIVRRLARGERALASELEDLSDGYDVVLGAIRDLIDAGFGPDHEEAVLERVDELAQTVPLANQRRASALVRVAARAVDAAEITGAHPQAAGYQRAVDALRETGALALPSRRVLIHGFADLTGVATDLVAAILQEIGGTVLVDRVPDPSDPAVDDAGNRFLQRLNERLGGVELDSDESTAERPEMNFFEAPDLEAEARWAAETARTVIVAGVEPESIGIVARRLDGLGPALRRQFHRLGVPFSGVGGQVPGGLPRRKSRRLADLLRRGSDAELDLWLEVAEGFGGGAGLLLGLRVLSLARLRDLAALRPDDRRVAAGVPLPLGKGLVPSEAGQSDGGRPARLSPLKVEAAVLGARVLIDVLEEWPSPVSAAAHRDQTERVLRALGWTESTEYEAAVREATDTLAMEFPAGLPLERIEWVSALVKTLDGIGEVPIGGDGGGVQVLTVTEARARTFKHLVLCGLVRGVFPRQSIDDPLLPDLVRARLALDVLPEMPVKARSADEERYLFAQLVSAAPTVDLSWHLGAGGRRMAPSPFVERLRAIDGVGAITTVPALWASNEPRPGPRPAYEHTVLTAVDRAQVALGTRLEQAIVEGRRGSPHTEWSVPTDRLATARLEVVDAAESGGSAPVMGPWFGSVGSAADPGPRLWVTHLESVATCPWRAYVGRRLGVRPLPDPHLGLPDLDHRLLGTVVHEVLENIVTGGETGKKTPYVEALEREPMAVPWPAKRKIEALLEAAAARVVFDEGLSGFGLARLLAAQARPVLEVARMVEWGDGGKREGVLAAEVEGEIRSGALRRTIAFRADRLDTGGSATDYKTGKPRSTAKQQTTRARHLLADVSTGRVLQAVAYALAAPAGDGTGRYLYLRPDIGAAPLESRLVEASGRDPELTGAFDTAVDAIDASLTAGAVFPRVEEPDGKTSGHCSFCEVSEACRRDDSRFSQTLVSLMGAQDEVADDVLNAARGLWWLGVDRTADG